MSARMARLTASERMRFMPRLQLSLESEGLSRTEAAHLAGQVPPWQQLTGVKDATHHTVDRSLIAAETDCCDCRPVRGLDFVRHVPAAVLPQQAAGELERARLRSCDD